MKYETLKHQVAVGLRSIVLRGGDHGGPSGPPLKYEAAFAAMFDCLAEKRPFQISHTILADKVYDIVMAWDVRQVGKLRELFPALFPANLRTGPLVAEYDEKGDWVVIRQPH